MADEDLFSKDYWAAPEIDPNRKGDANPSAIYSAVGNATTMWETIEDALAMLLTVLSKANTVESHNVVKYIFDVVESSSQRLKIIEAVAAIYFGNWWERAEIRKPFHRLMDSVSKASWRRNEFAHGKHYYRTRNDDGEQVQTVHGSFLVAPDYMVARQRGFHAEWPSGDPLATFRSNYRYTSKDIIAFCFSNSEPCRRKSLSI